MSKEESKEEKEFDQIKYQNEYKKKNYDRMELLVPKGEKAIIKEAAAALGQSVKEFVYSAIKEKMECEAENFKSAQSDTEI